ncbi:MAG TPA: fatty acid oxidation complex subunit alpha FadJ [Gemmatimonadaceae bacterium]|nr:fatty acid oxidation complex subunit alpha FadJ [Gemmatimonadaceae bacterium]
MTAAAGVEAAFTNLRLDLEDDVAVVTLDMPNEPVNTLRKSVIDEFARVFELLESEPAVKGAVLISGKPDIFIAGADIEQFLELKSGAEATALSRAGQALLDRLEKLRVPVVAAINGACLGGGLESALACAYRIASDNPKTVLALPEVQLGLIPGAGGTQRLPRTIGLTAALDMILTGKNVRAKKALQLGLVDELVHPAILRDVAVKRARELGAGTRERSEGHKGSGIAARALEGTPPGRAIVFRQARQQTASKTKGNYPAPLAAIDAIETGYHKGMEAGLAEEARLFGELSQTEVSRQLIFLFFATTALKKDTGVADPNVKGSAVRKIAILGAGFMGAGIATVAVQAGTVVRLKDADTSRVANGLRSIREVLKENLTKRRTTRQQFDDQLVLVSGTTDYSGFRDADIVIEAVFEDISVKHQVIRETEKIVGENAIFASNTSTIPIARLAQASARPDRVIGMHFFSPVHKMPLLEVIVHDGTADEVTATVVAYGKKLGKTVIVVNDGPGFFANRILTPYINEAGKLLDEGAKIEQIDRALVDFGFPVGPITLLDEVGIDIAGKSGNIIADAFGERMRPSSSLAHVLSAGRYGRKNRKGFYKYDEKGKKQGVDDTIYDLFPNAPPRRDYAADEIRDRTVMAMLNEAARALEDGIVRSPRDGDIGAVFGIGFPPFRGGPFRYMDTLGIGEVVRRLETLNARLAGRYEPAPILVRMAAHGERFYAATGKPVD